MFRAIFSVWVRYFLFGYGWHWYRCRLPTVILEAFRMQSVRMQSTRAVSNIPIIRFWMCILTLWYPLSGRCENIGVPKAVRKRSAITSHASLLAMYNSMNTFSSTLTLLRIVFGLVACNEGRSWQADRSWYDDEFSALSGESSRGRSQT